MSGIKPLTKETASSEVHGLFDNLKQKTGKVPNFFALMAHRPDVLSKFVPLYGAIMEGGTVPARYKELAYLKTSTINGCEY